jgi:NADPH-dependent curcumin reductase CurA
VTVTAARNRQIILTALPEGKLAPEHFALREVPLATVSDGEVGVRVRYLSLDAANRAWMQGATYRDAILAGSVMAGAAVAEVIESQAPSFARGDLVFADTGWQEYAVLPAKRLSKLPNIEPMTHLLSVYGIAGLTAYFGLLKIAPPRPGETVVVSAAAGSVGSLVGQIAKLQGCRVVGIAGGREKCAWLSAELGFDAAVDYKAGSLFRDLKAAAPKGIDVYFDNVGGETFEACLAQMNIGGRISCCGAISAYDGAPPKAGPRGIPGLIIVKRLTIKGFIVTDFFAEREQAIADLRAWVAAKKLKVHEDVIDGLENAPAALIGLLAGANRGKRMVKVA